MNDWVRARHDAWNTPHYLINEYVQKVAGSAIANAKRLVIGQDNEVYDVSTADSRQLIVRISRKDDPRFEAERWAMNAARRAGVPTPQVLLVEQATYDDSSVTFCIEEKLPGKPLDVLLADGRNNVVDEAIDQIGEVLNQLHGVKVDGFGYLDPNGKGPLKSFAERMRTINEQRDELYEAAKKWNVQTKDITTGLALLNDHKELYQFDTPSLIHGDFAPKHILISGNRISGVIDMQDCSGNHPVFDFVTWDMYSSKLIPTSRIVASYCNQSLFGGDYDALFHLVLLRGSLVMLMVQAADENPNSIQVFIAEMERALKYFAKTS
ncbi:MAG TPA: aminoglycoside phosphotransferase family protein [Ktedonobacteraceae bacterium]